MMSKYECDQCGACCKGTLLVEAYELDVVREPKLISANIGKWTHDKTRAQIMERLREEDSCLIIAGSQPCKFLGSDNACAIYPTRPNVCVAMEAGDEQCQMARQSAGLEPLEPLDTISADSSMQKRAAVSISMPCEFARHFEEAFDRLDRTDGRLNFVSLIDLRRELSGFNREQFDEGIKGLRRSRKFSLSAAEGRLGISEDQKNAAILEAGSLLLFVSRRS